MNFVHSFWPTGNKYRESIGRLDERFQQSISENKQIVNFIKSWLAIEDLYGNSLKDLAGKKLSGFLAKKDPVNFPEDGASLGRAYDALKENCINKGLAHLDGSKKIHETVLVPLQTISEDHEEIYLQMKEELLERITQFEKAQSVLEIANANYIEKCRIADKLEENAVSEAHRQEEANNLVPRNSVTYIFGKLNFSEPDLKAFLKRAQSEGASQDSKTMFLGLLRGLQSGESIVQWLLHAYSKELLTPADAAEVGQALIDQNLLRLIGPGNQFRLASTAFYQWKRRADDYDDGESPHYRARKIAGEADLHYRNAVGKAESLRTQLEEYTHNYLIAMERNEETRIESIKAAFLNMAKTESTLASSLVPLVQSLFPHLETLKPKQDVALMVETFATGPFRPTAILYRNYYHGPEIEQSFGVDIDDQARAGKTTIPPTFNIILEFIDKALAGLPKEAQFEIWCSEVPLGKVHSCRAAINNPPPSPDSLIGYDADVLVATLRLFLLELPDSLIPGWLYESLKSACSETEDNLRWLTVSSRLAELSLPQRTTLNALISRLRTVIEGLEQSDASFHLLLSTYTHCILRPPPQSSSYSIHHRHPQRVLKDLLLHPEGLLNPPSDKELSDWLIASPKDSPAELVDLEPHDSFGSPSQPKESSAEPLNLIDTPPQLVEISKDPPPALTDKKSEDDDEYLDLDLAQLDGDDVEQDPDVNLKDDFFDDI